MRRLRSIEFIADGGGRYNVYRDSELISWHTSNRKALETALNEQNRNPDSKVWIEQKLRIDVKADFDEQTFQQGTFKTQP